MSTLYQQFKTSQKGVDRLLDVFLLLALTLLVTGLVLPVLKVRQLFIFVDEFSLLESIASLWENGDYFIAVIVTLFTVIFPFAKLVFAEWLWRFADTTSDHFKSVLAALEITGKWSMLDVLVLALIIFSIKATGIADATLQHGLYLFFTAVVMTMLITWRIKRHARKALGLPPEI